MNLGILNFISISAFISLLFGSSEDYHNVGIIVTSPHNGSQKILLKDIGSMTNLSSEFFDVNLPTIFYSSGFQDNFENVRSMMEAFQLRGGFNFLVIDWFEYSFDDYVTVTRRVKKIADMSGDALFRITKNSNNFSNWHFIGHSLGAHMVGLIARRIHKISNKKNTNSKNYGT